MEHPKLVTDSEALSKDATSLKKIISEADVLSFETNADAFKDAKEYESKLRNKDIASKLTMHRFFVGYFSGLIFVQNLLVFSFVFIYVLCITKYVDPALLGDTLQKSEVFMSVIIAGTLGETYLIARIMVEWVFKDIDYRQ